MDQEHCLSCFSLAVETMQFQIEDSYFRKCSRYEFECFDRWLSLRHQRKRGSRSKLQPKSQS